MGGCRLRNAAAPVGRAGNAMRVAATSPTLYDYGLAGKGEKHMLPGEKSPLIFLFLSSLPVFHFSEFINRRQPVNVLSTLSK